MTKQELLVLLANRIPEKATSVHVLEDVIYFSMPPDWKPTEISGIFSVRYCTDSPPLVGRWQYRR